MKRACLFVFSIALPLSGVAQQPPISVEWIYSDAGEALTRMPEFAWQADGRLLLQQRRQVPEVVRPERRTREPLAGWNQLDSSLGRNSGSSASSPAPLPAVISRDGRRAIEQQDGRLVFLDIEQRQARVLPPGGGTAPARSPRFSPDGTRIAYVQANDLYACDLDEAGKVHRLTDDGSETVLNGTLSWVYWEEIFGRRDIGYWWSPDSRKIAYLRTDESEVEQAYFLDPKAESPEEATAIITQRYPRAGGINPTVSLKVATLGTPGARTIQLPDAEYLARVKWLPDSSALAVQTLNRAQNRLDLYFIDLESGETTRVLTETDPAWVNLHDDLYFLDDGHFLWRSERDGYAHLYRYRMDGRLVNQVTKGDWALRSSGGVFWLRQSVMHIDEDRGHVYFTALKDSSIERHLYRIDLDGGGLTRISRQPGTHNIAFSPTGDYYIDTFSSATEPPSMTLRDRNGTPVMTLVEPKAELAASLNFRQPEFFTIPTRDGFPMPAEILKPADFDPAKAYPIIFHIYAGPSAPTVFNAWRTDRYFDQLLLGEGYLVVRFDHPSAAGISKKLENRVHRMMSGPIEMADIVDGVRWLKAKPWVDPGRFGIWGWSGGGSFTLNAMTNTREFAAGISVAPVTDWRFYDTKWAEFAMKTPKENPEGYRKTSFLESAPDLHGRLLLVHGTYDDNVHPRNSWAFIEKLVQAGIAFDMMLYPMRKHGIGDRPARIHLFNKMLEFWRQHL